jgi:hypothetical protein
MHGLKEFQRATVDYVFQRLYTDADPIHRFLVADEVGLGKTLVARGVIAKVIDHLRERGVKRIDVIYICSNADIAKQNIQKLNVTGQEGFDLATRITLLPTQLRKLKAGEINLVSFTPGTSFAMGARGGRKDERALVYWLLRHAWGSRRLRHPGVFRLLRGRAGETNWEHYVTNYQPQRVGRGADRIDPEVAERFAHNLRSRDERDRLQGNPTIRERFDAVADRLRHRDRIDQSEQRQELVGELRGILARSAIDALEPDLIILDEFQRFRHLLEDPDDEDDLRTLARQLIDYESVDGHARTLLLSATPYKMYTLSAESGHDDHYDDFLKTTEFLLGDQVGAFRAEIRSYREAVFELEGLQPAGVRRRSKAIETRLRRVMCRTERLAVTPDRSGMLVQRAGSPVEVTQADARTFVALDAVSRRLGASDPIDYWKSAPYPLSFMEGYDVKRRLRDALFADPAAAADVAHALSGGDGLIDPVMLTRYEEVDSGNGRLRALASDMLDSGAWRLLWVPPSLPYYVPQGPYGSGAMGSVTKRLVFSSWTVVPQAVASVLSYGAERRMMRERDPKASNTPEARRRIRPLLQFRRANGRPAAMSTFGLVYPSVTVARLTDPFELSTPAQRVGSVPSPDAICELATERLSRQLAPILKGFPADGPVDDDWYWAAPIILERRLDSEALKSFFQRRNGELERAWFSSGDEEVNRDDLLGFGDHLTRARQAAFGWVPEGRPPDDLAETLALVGVAGPANVALRALARGAAYRTDLSSPDIRVAACRVAWGFRSLFSVPEVTALVRSRSGTERAYWRRVLGYCLDGNLQAVIDEYGHVLPEWLGILDAAPTNRAGRVAKAMYEALTIRAPQYGYDAVRVSGEAVSLASMRLRSRFALRFGVDTIDQDRVVQRSGQVRGAFNSPFWPFVLVTTSVGQEGLDFHQYCHAIVHWNLPANPVDFEQREGRVHRYKGHAVRRNVAAEHQREAFRARVHDPWAAAFAAARRSRQASRKKDIVPFWIYEGVHRIERYVPMLPMSKEIDQLQRLKRSLAVYRMVFGQPRQEDLAAFLSDRISPEVLGLYQEALSVNLSPSKTRQRS